jgi:hypothetical protein
MIDRSLNYGRHQIARFVQNNRSIWVLITAKPTSRVLDLGAGHGTDLTTARRVLPESQLIAVESWPPYVEELKSLSVGICAPHRARCLTLRGWIGRHCHRQSNTGTYQRVFLDIPSGLQGVLPVGGQFIVGVPNRASLHNRILLACGRQPSSLKSASAHVRGFTRADLLHFVQSCFPNGFELDRFGGGNFYPFPPFLAKPLARMFPNLAWGIFLSLRKKIPYHNQFLKFPPDQRLETNF